MNKNRLLKILSFALILIGIVLIALPRINHSRIGNRVEKNYEVAVDLPAETLKENMEKETTFNFEAVDQITTSGTLLSTDYVDSDLIIGRLMIPSINLNLTLYNGLTNDILLAGVGTMRPGLTMGEGNFPIAGHYTYGTNEAGILFTDLTSVQMGDEIYLTDNNMIYEYVAYDSKVVEPSEVHWIDDAVAAEHGKPIISLMNCYFVDGVDTGDRYFLFGELVDSYPVEENI